MSSHRDWLISLACVLLGLGVLMVHSASITSWPTEFERVYLSRHLAFLALGALLACGCAGLPAVVWYRAAPWLFAASAALLVLVLVPGIGATINGAQRWIRFGTFSIQPSELAKLALPLLICRMAHARRAGMGSEAGLTAGRRTTRGPGGSDGAATRLWRWLGGTVPFLIPPALVVPLVLAQPDLGTALFLTAGWAVALFVCGWPVRNFVLCGMVAVPACLSLVAIRPYQWQRISGFLAAWSDLGEAPWQLTQSLVSLGEGGLWGVGLGRGWQKLSFLPEANTDFVFAVVGEELGLVGTLGIVGVWVAIYVAGLKLLGGRDRASFEYRAGFTLLTQLVLQAALNVAVVTAMVPPKGIPHPLISYGGSNLVVSLASLGIVVSLARRREPESPFDSSGIRRTGLS